MTNNERDRQALEAFLLDNPELAQLESLVDEFNLFEVIGTVRQELRHSDVLAFLLSPQERHGLGPAFLQQLLLAAVRGGEGEGWDSFVENVVPGITAVLRSEAWLWTEQLS